jgi:hypothetical protein
MEFAYVKREVMHCYAQNLHEEIISKFSREKMHELLKEEYERLLNDNSK